jgi:hypothetical protein
LPSARIDGAAHEPGAQLEFHEISDRDVSASDSDDSHGAPPTSIGFLEPEVEQVVAEGLRRHRHGARFTIDRIAELDGLRRDLAPDHAIALLSAATPHHAWYELVHAHKLSWDEAEQTVNDALIRAILKPN